MTRPIQTWGEFMAASPKERRACAQEWLTDWEKNHNRQWQLDMEADHRAFRRGTIDPPGPIDNQTGRQSSTNRMVDQ